MVLDELAEGLGRHVDAAEKLEARRAPALATAFQDGHVGIAKLGKAGKRFLRQALAAAVEQDDRRALARDQVADDELQPRERRSAGEKRVAAVMHALLAHVEQRELAAAGEQLANARRG